MYNLCGSYRLPQIWAIVDLGDVTGCTGRVFIHMSQQRHLLDTCSNTNTLRSTATVST